MINKGCKKYPNLDLRYGNILESPFESNFFKGLSQSGIRFQI